MRIDAILNRVNIYLLFLCLMTALSACSPKASQVKPEQPPKAISISSLEVGMVDDRSLITVRATESLQGSYTVIKLTDPPRVVVEMPTVDVGKFDGSINEGNGAIARVTTSRLNGTGARMEVILTSLVEHEVKAEGNTLEIYFAKPQAPEAPAEKVEEKVKVEEAPQEKAEVKAEAAPSGEEKAAVPSAVAEAKKEEKTEVSKKTIKVTDVKIRKAGKFTIADIITDGEPSDYNVFDLKSPARVVVDLGNARKITAKKDIKAVSPHIKGARLGRSAGYVRVVFDYKGVVQPYEVVKGKDRITIFFGKKPVAAVAKVEKATAKEEAPKKEEAQKPEEKAEKTAEVAKVVAKPEVNEAAPVKEAKTEAKVEEKATEETKPEAPKKEEAKPEERKEATPVEKAAVPAVEAKMVQESKALSLKEGAGKVYAGQKVTLEFKDADIKNIFRVIAEISGYNMIIDNSVSGKVTLRLVNVPWDQALDLILETNNLGMTKVGNVIRVLPVALIRKDEQDKLEAKSVKEKQEDLVTKLIPVSYAKASDITTRIKGVMSLRGTADVDDRTNTIILKDIQKSIDAAVKLVASLDAPTPQVVIEARIVEANTNFTRDLGVQWGAGHTADAAHGNPTGYYFPNSYNINAGGGGSFALNPPATGGVGASGGPGGVIGISFGSINNTLNLDLRLSALETQGWGKVISSPKIITLDNKEASIQQGISIPFETTSASGTQTTFVDANLNLTVTPHVTADGRLSMKIKATKNAPSLAFKGASGAPSIDKKEASTEILVKDGDTTVIGGIYQITKAESESYTPFLGKIPVIGWLFKSKSVEDTKTELLIFITPRIVRENPV